MVTRYSLAPDQAGLPVPNPTKSFWHKEPSQKLLGHRTTPDLPETADVVVVGSGITGAFAGWFLKSGDAKGKRVVMLEAREAGWGATGRNGGHCQPNVYAPLPHIAKHELATFKFLREFVKEHDIPCDWVDTTGVRALLTQEVCDIAKAKMDKVKNDPELAKNAKIVLESEDGGKKELASLRVPTAKGAVVQFNAAALWPYKLVAWVLETLLEEYGPDGFNLQTNTPVTGLHQIEASPQAQEGHTWLLSTGRGEIAAKQVLLCCNGYVSRLLPKFTGFVLPVRGQMSAIVPPLTLDQNIGHSYVFIGRGDSNVNQRDYLIQRGENASSNGNGFLMFGGGRGWDACQGLGVWNDGEVDPTVAAYLRGELRKCLDMGQKNLGDSRAEGDLMEAKWEWTGIMGYSRDGCPWVGPVPEALGGGEGLWVCGGYTGHGMPAAPLCAQGVVKMMNGESDEGSGASKLPKEFLITEERLQAAGELDTIKVTEELGVWLF